SFLDSHVEFEAPPAPLSDSTPSGPSAAMKPLPRDEEAAWKNRFDILLSGPGFEVATIRRGRLTAAIVDDVRPGSAADRAGITPGWALPFLSTTVDKDGIRFTGTFLELTGDAAQTLERTGHPPGAATAGPQDPYTLEHGAKHQYEPDLSPTRTDFETRRLAGNVTYLRFDHFFAGDIMSRAFDAIDSAGPEGMIIDLRHNRGGVMTQLQRFLGRLLGNDVDIGRLRVGESTSRMRTWRWGSIYQGPVIMLIGPQSMSAAEIAAAAVQDHKRGLVIGRMSSGAVLNGRKYPLPDGGTIMVPVQDYYRAANRRIEGVGVEPDVRVLATLEDVRAHRDPALDRALQLLPSLRAEMPAPREPAELSR
ncbi:MAG TPA: S41 family peptidase, partial [Steroidobacteraceae bacterium]|nr:S41 family peptidase [Steroidobacteraceae bacterium]